MFGIARTTAASKPSQREMSTSRTPAATETSNGRRSAAISLTVPVASRMLWGLTASTTVSACATASALSAVVRTR